MADQSAAAIASTEPGHYGASGIGLTLQALRIGTAWNVQGEAASPVLAARVQQLFGVTLPVIPNTAVRGVTLSALWIGPHSWLLVTGGELPFADFDARRDALNAAGGALFDVSASSVAWRIAGPRAAEVLNKGCPLDLDLRAFVPGTCAQSVFGHLNCLVWRERDDASFLVMVGRSFAHVAWHLLCVSCAQYGYDVLPPATQEPS